MNVLRSVLSLNKNMKNNVARKCANIPSISERINNSRNHGTKNQY